MSVVVVAYDHERFVRQAVEGALAQRTGFGVEILVSDDGSTDATPAVVDALAAAHPDRVRVFHYDRSRVIYYEGRPTGRRAWFDTVAHARGRYVAMLDGDDYWTDPEKLAIQVARLERRPSSTLSLHAVAEEGPDGKRVVRRFAEGDQTFGLESIVRENFIRSASVVLRRDVVEDLPEWHLRSPVGDWPLYVRCAQLGGLEYVDRVMAVRRLHSGGRWHSMPAIDRYRQTADTQRFFRAELDPGHRAELDRHIALNQGRALLVARRTRGLLGAIRYASSALRQCRADGRSVATWCAVFLRLLKSRLQHLRERLSGVGTVEVGNADPVVGESEKPAQPSRAV